jgi:hypothetical protein
MSSEFTELCAMYGLSPSNPDAIDIITDDCNGKATDDHDSDWERFEELCFELGVDPEDPDAHFKLYDPEDDEDDLYDYNY